MRTVGDGIWILVKSTIIGGDIDAFIVETLLMLIPKESRSTRLKNIHPINLYNVIFKVVTKFLLIFNLHW